VLTFIRFDMRAPSWGPASAAELHTATLEIAEWADRVGFDSAVVSEHHGAVDGFLPSPIVAAAAIAGRTRRIGISISALLAPLHDPIRIAEDLAVLDLLSEGRVTTILGLGYRPEEYEMFDAPWDTRGAWFDEWVQGLLDAWKGEDFVFRDRKVLPVTPAPFTDPHPPIFIGGRSKAAARRAARFGLNFFPDSSDPALRDAYEAACRAEGNEPGLMVTPEDPVTFVFVHDDPDGYWERIGPHVLHEATTYAGWQREGETSSASTDATSIEELKAGDRFAVLTPDEAVEHGRDGNLLLYPLCGGIPPELAWESLHLVEHEVLPRVRPGS
jgi:alkanesulfonate monooxygenase SsuD/methylene tetrahydromethanopterin reductase-like flavin-dependent oxidoreductase (luciferase family)